MGGVGIVNGVAVVVIANVGSIQGGTINPPTMARCKRSLFAFFATRSLLTVGVAATAGRLVQVAMDNRLPVIRLTESGGADLRVQAEVFHSGGECTCLACRVCGHSTPIR